MANYIGQTLTQLKTNKSPSLLKNLIIAKLEGEMVLKNQQGDFSESTVSQACQKEIEGIRDAFISFLTHPKLNFTISELKASLELEEFKTSAPLNAQVDTSVNTQVAAPIPVQVGVTGTGATTTPGVGAGTGKGMVTEPLKMSKGGGKGGARHGGRLIATGHAYVGLNDPTPSSDTIDEENDFTKVRLFKSKIPKELL